MKAQKEMVRYGWHDCLNGLSERGRREKPSPLGAGNDTLYDILYELFYNWQKNDV